MPAADADLKVCRIASLTLTNAMIFQQVLAERDTRVESLNRAVKSPHVAESLLNTWTFIVEKIDYIPIFTTATEIMKDLVGVPDVDAALKRLGDAALRITSRVFRPGVGDIGKVPLVLLKAIADIGPDRRDIHDGFKPTSQDTEYPAFWGHDTTTVQRIAQKPNMHLIALAHAKKGRNLRDAHLLWSRSGRLLIAERLRLTTARLVAVRTSEKVLSNTWWPVAADNGMDKPLALWFNSSLGLLSLISSRVDTEGAWVELKKPILESLAVLDPRRLPKKAQEALVQAYDQLAKLELQPVPQIAKDDVRSKIDAAIAEALGIEDDLSVLRMLLASEPVMSMRLP